MTTRSRFRSRAGIHGGAIAPARRMKLLDGVLRHTPPEFVEHVNNSARSCCSPCASLIDHDCRRLTLHDRAKSLHTARAAESKSGGSA
jgi:hypothetical protein